MPTVVDQVEIVVAANGTVDNAFQGRRFERAPMDSNLTLYVTGSAAGLEGELNVGGRSASPRVPLGTQNRTPVVPDDVLIGDVEADQGELIQFTLYNTTAGALTARVRVDLTEDVEFFEEF